MTALEVNKLFFREALHGHAVQSSCTLCMKVENCFLRSIQDRN